MSKPLQGIIDKDFDVTEVGFLRRIWLIFRTVQPLLTIGHFCLERSSKMHSMFFFVRFYGGLAASAVFFDTAGDAPSSTNSDPECIKPADFWGSLVYSMMVGIASSFVSTVPVFTIGVFETRGFT